MDTQISSDINSSLREEAINEVQKEQTVRRRKLSAIEFIKAVSKKFIELQIDAFPMYCDVARVQNKLKQDELRLEGIKGKYTDSYGWSEGRTFKHDYEIPSELYLFMTNLVYRDFWASDNEKVWRKFMHKICMGEDSIETLMWAKSIYGSNSQKEMVVG